MVSNIYSLVLLINELFASYLKLGSLAKKSCAQLLYWKTQNLKQARFLRLLAAVRQSGRMWSAMEMGIVG